MQPNVYFPAKYHTDLRVFSNGEVPTHGPFWMLCGWTLGGFLEPGRIKQYDSPEGFLCSIYQLNLLHQGIYTYFREDYPKWTALCEPFPDLRGCHSHHGGVSSPASLINFVKNPSYTLGSKPLYLTDELLLEFTDYFFHHYLRSLCQKGKFVHLSSDGLAARLRGDPDCGGYAKFMEPGPAGK